MNKILIVLDGAAGIPLEILGNKTPIDKADTKNLDYLAENGEMGYMYPIDEKTAPGSDNSLIAIFGNDPKKCRRGIYEALGLNINLRKGDFAIRTNFGTVESLSSGIVIDRRAGRTLTTDEALKLGDAINSNVKLPCEFIFKNSVQHRGVLVLRGKFSDKVSNFDPEWSNSGNKVLRKIRALDDSNLAKKTVEILNSFTSQVYHLLKNHPVNFERKRKGFFPANILLMRGGGVKMQKLKKYPDWMSINSMPLEMGISRALGMDCYNFEYPKLKKIDAYATLYKALRKSIKFSKKIIKKHHKNYSGCYIQFKETDLPGHDNKPFDKINMMEIIDKKFFKFLRKFAEKRDIRIVVTCDHSTPCKLKRHSSNPVPVLVYDGKHKDDTKKFSEKESHHGKFGKMYGTEFMKKTGLRRS